MNKNSLTVSFWVGVFFVFSLLCLMFFAVSISNGFGLRGESGYTVTARFSHIGGLQPQSPVTASGVLVGRVQSITFDSDSYQALVAMTLFHQHSFPDDSSASIFTAGLLGEQYINLDPGASDFLLEEGSEIEYTQSAVVLEKLIGKFLLSQTEKE